MGLWTNQEQKVYWYLLAEASKGADKATSIITETCVIATMHTFTLNSHTAILKTYGIVESASKPFGLNRIGAMRDWGMKTMDSALQNFLYQRLLEEYGGESWNLETLPPVVAN